MSKFLDRLSELGLDISINTVESLNNIAQMETVDFNSILKGVEDIAGKALDNDTILNLKKHAMQFQQTIVKDGGFVDDLADGIEAIGVLEKIQNIAEYGELAVDVVSNVGGMIDIVRSDELTEEQKIEMFEVRFDELKEQGADTVMAVFDSTFGNIPYAGPVLSAAVEDKMRNFVTSESGLEKISNDIGDFFDRGIDSFATKTGIKDWLQNRYNKEPESTLIEENDTVNTNDLETTENFTPMDEVNQSEMEESEIFESSQESSDIAAELKANMNLLYENLDSFATQISEV